VVAVSGTGLTVAAGAAGRDGLGHDIHGTTVTVAAVRDEVRRLREMTVAERRDLGYMDPGRADVIAAGALILEAVLERTQVDELRVSVTDILDGIAWSCVGA
jgi:exopolyphosphatase/guanosine-5'-triphosphate,3'-diphosphate pyrophosphatase